MLRLTNYHAHTPRCQHAVGTEEEYIQTAIRLGYKVLGFSDHTPWPYTTSFRSGIRMHVSELDSYVATLRHLKEKYADSIEIHIGLECEAFPEFFPWLQELKEEGKVEFLIIGNHFDTSDERGGSYFGRCRNRDDLLRYLEMTTIAMESGLFSCLAHPDLCLFHYPSFDPHAEFVCRELCCTAKRLDIPMEFNILGYTRTQNQVPRTELGYSTDEFWQIASQVGVKAIIGVDAHDPKQLECLDLINQVRSRLTRPGITLTDTLKID